MLIRNRLIKPPGVSRSVFVVRRTTICRDYKHTNAVFLFSRFEESACRLMQSDVHLNPRFSKHCVYARFACAPEAAARHRNSLRKRKIMRKTRIKRIIVDVHLLRQCCNCSNMTGTLTLFFCPFFLLFLFALLSTPNFDAFYYDVLQNLITGRNLC